MLDLGRFPTAAEFPPYEETRRKVGTPPRSSLTPPHSPWTVPPVATNQTQLPHPADNAAREALAKAPPAPLSRVLEQARASDLWRKKHASSAGTQPKPA